MFQSPPTRYRPSPIFGHFHGALEDLAWFHVPAGTSADSKSSTSSRKSMKKLLAAILTVQSGQSDCPVGQTVFNRLGRPAASGYITIWNITMYTCCKPRYGPSTCYFFTTI